MKYFAYRHLISFEETNLVGNVFYVNHIRWQGLCRERFLHQHAPEIVTDLGRGYALVTLACSCRYFVELHALEEVEIRMHLKGLTRNQIDMEFEYIRRDGEGGTLAARGNQQVAWMKREEKGMAPAPLPGSLRRALESFL